MVARGDGRSARLDRAPDCGRRW